MRIPSSLRRWLYSPHIPDHDRQFQANLLNCVSGLALLLTITATIVNVVTPLDSRLRLVWIGVLLTGTIITRIFLYQAKIELGSFVLIGTLSIFALLLLLNTGRPYIFDINFFVFLGFFGGLLLPPPQSKRYFPILIIIGGGVYFLRQEIPRAALPTIPATPWAPQPFNFFLSALLLFVFAYYLRRALLGAYRQEQKLAHSNQQLQEEIKRREEAQQALAESEHRYRMLFGKAPLGLFHFNGDGLIIDCNDQFVKIIGSSRQTLVGMNMLERLRDEEMVAAIRRTIAQGTGYYEGNYTSVTAAKETPVRVLLSRVTAVDSPHWQGLGIVEDITQRRRSEEALRRTQKLESLGVMAGGVAHDFNNLLVAMVGQMSLARLKMDKSAPGYSHVEKGQKAAERAAELTRQLLVYSGHSKFETGPIYLNDVIEDNLHLFRLAIPAQVILRPQLSADLPPIRGDMGQIQQVIMNLIINGAEAIGDKAGAVTVRTTLQTLLEPRPTHSGHALTPGTYVVLTVEDDGCGMDEETQDKIFDPFFTTKFTGRGLGLAAVLGIVRGHDAGLQVKSAPEEGTEFCIYFPPTAVSPETPPAPPSAPETIAAAILIIDDEEPVRTAAADILSHHAYQILTASGGEEGIARCEAASPPVDLALLDLSMPGLSGEETFHRLRALQPSLPILFTSGYAPPETVNELQQEAHVAFLQKPYTAAQLHRAVSQLLTRDRRRTNTSPG